jgi:hypothetical protein
LSYAREDSQFALQLAKGLRASGESIWLDQLDIAPGERWDKSVEEALASCGRVLVILSPISVASTSVVDEVPYALDERKTLIPILYRDCPIPLRLRRLQYVDFRANYPGGMQNLLDVFGRVGKTTAAREVKMADRDAPETTQTVELRDEPKGKDARLATHAQTAVARSIEPVSERFV